MKNKVCFEYENEMLISTDVEEVKNWINSLPGITCNKQTEENLHRILNTQWQVWGYNNQNISPVGNGGFRLEHLKTTGIKTGKITFFLTEHNTCEEILAEREAFRLKVEGLKIKVSELEKTLGSRLLEKLSKKSKSCVELRHFGGTQFSIKIGRNGYWFNDGFGGYYAYVNEYFTHFDGETLITDENKNVVDILNKNINEN